MSLNALVYDCEIARMIPPAEPGISRNPALQYCEGWGDYDNMGISVVGVYSYRESRYRVFMQDNLAELPELFRECRLAVGFNNIHFDNPLLAANGVLVEFERSYDLLREMWLAAGLGMEFDRKKNAGYGLEKTIAANFPGLGKSGRGEFAPELFQTGQYGRLVDYCLNDVHLTRRLFDRVMSRQGIRDPKTGELRWLRLPEGLWEE